MAEEIKIDNVDIKLQALEDAISYPLYKETKDVHTINVNSFDYDIISEQIIGNQKLANLEGAKIDNLLELIKLLADNKNKYGLDQHNYICFYWSGLPLVAININNSAIQKIRMIYVSTKLYRDELQNYLTDKKISNVVGAMGGILLMGSIIAGYIILKKSE